MPASDNPFLDPQIVAGYEQWYSTAGCRADVLEKRLISRLLRSLPDAHTVLEVGCGTGHFSRWLSSQGYSVTGLDASPAMVVEAMAQGSDAIIRGGALNLPFPLRAFDVVLMITTLEFTSDPLRVLAEAARVAKYGILLGVLNRTSVPARRRRATGGSIWDAATFYSPSEFARLVRQAAGDDVDSIRWRTTLWPIPFTNDLPLPWGGFIGLLCKLNVQRASAGE